MNNKLFVAILILLALLSVVYTIYKIMFYINVLGYCKKARFISKEESDKYKNDLVNKLKNNE